MKVLILGGHGFVGRNLREILTSPDYEIVALSRRDGFDLRDLGLVRDYFRDQHPDVVVNLAAHVGSLHYVTQYAADVLYDNIQTALNLYKAVTEFCPKVRIVNPLSNCSYPGDANKHNEPDWWQGEVHDSVFSYGNAKRFIYVISKTFRRQYGIDTVNFLVPNTFGPGDYTDPNKTHALNGMIIRMILAQRNGYSHFEIWGSGKPIREWGYIKDVVRILAFGLTIKHDLIYPVNIGQNKGYSIKESAEMIAEEVGFSGDLVFNTNYQDGAPFKILDDGKFRTLFPDYRFYDHRQGIRETVEYYKSIL
jgi:GDP-L-fucose synthase